MVATPLIYPGGKTRLIPHLLPILKGMNHMTYVELFGGGMPLLLAKKPSKTEVYNDIGNVHRFWKVMRDPNKYVRLINLLELTPYSRQEYFEDDMRLAIAPVDDDVEWARQWFTVVNQCFTHEEDGHSWRSSKSHSVGQSWVNHNDRLWQVAERIRRVVIENRDALEVIPLYDHENTLFYADPPYIQDLQKDKAATKYANEMTPFQHRKLIEALDSCKGQVILSGYDSYMYSKLLDDKWKKYTVVRMAQVGNSSYTKRKTRTECIWVKKHKPKFVQDELFPESDVDTIEVEAEFEEVEEAPYDDRIVDRYVDVAKYE